MNDTAMMNSTPPHANDIYKQAYNAVWQECGMRGGYLSGEDCELSCNKVALAAIRHGYKKARHHRWIKV